MIFLGRLITYRRRLQNIFLFFDSYLKKYILSLKRYLVYKEDFLLKFFSFYPTILFNKSFPLLGISPFKIHYFSISNLTLKKKKIYMNNIFTNFFKEKYICEIYFNIALATA